jgi:hypothetical protein
MNNAKTYATSMLCFVNTLNFLALMATITTSKYKARIIKFEIPVTILKSCPICMPKALATALLKPRNCSESGCGDEVLDADAEVFIPIVCDIRESTLSPCPTERITRAIITIRTLAKRPVQLKNNKSIGNRKKGTSLVNAAIVSPIHATV